MARKEHVCGADCGEPIRAGQTYVRVAIPAWLDFEGDVDDEGRLVAVLRDANERRWMVFKAHEECWNWQY